MDPYESFAGWLLQRRKALDLTRRDLARAVGVSPVTIEKLESGARKPSRQVAELLAGHLGVPAAELAAFVQFARAGGVPDPAALPAAGGAPWRALLHYANNLPAPATPFIGRQALLADLQDLVQQPGVRLVTLVGPPGIGKTRLALALGTRALAAFTDGVFFVPLAPVRDPALVLPAIAGSLQIREQGARPLGELIQEELRARERLLLLDNFEQVVAAGPIVTDLLRAAPGLKVLVTSREALHVYGEQVFAVPPMEAPPAGPNVPAVEQLGRYEAVALFVERARAADRRFALTAENAPAVVQICIQLDAVPLAIELAAAHVARLAPAAILERLQARLDLLAGGPRDVPSRQQALRGAIDWSHDLLGEGERSVFRRLAVFAGGCTLPAAEAIAGPVGGVGPLLESLAAKSLLHRATRDGEPRFGMLETIREYAMEQLRAGGEESALRHQHAVYYLTLVEEGSRELRGPQQAVWLARLEAEHDNLRAALRWAIAVGEAAIALQLSNHLRWFWYLRDYLSEGRYWLAAALASAPVQPSPARADALMSLGVLAERQGDHAEAVRVLDASLAIYRTLDDPDGVARVLNNLGGVALEHGEYEAASRHYDEALGIWRAQGNQLLAGMALHNLSIIAYSRSDFANALALCRECVRIMEAENKPAPMGRALTTMGEIYRLQGQYDEAARHYERSLAILQELGDKRGTSSVLMNLGHVEHHRGRLDRAESYIQQALELDAAAGDRAGVALDLAGLAGIAGTRGQGDRAARLFGAADTLRELLQIPFEAPDQAEYDQSLATVQAQMPADVWAAAWAAGRALPLEQAIQEALASGQSAPA
ncbi:MAG TPA: tetratricopeptide repeat protein [Chloroflexia bacterium]|nr:tetratricopeptide repeat protein [Chloroflexia bacterium]